MGKNDKVVVKVWRDLIERTVERFVSIVGAASCLLASQEPSKIWNFWAKAYVHLVIGMVSCRVTMLSGSLPEAIIHITQTQSVPSNELRRE
jgi:hypothetical protein